MVVLHFVEFADNVRRIKAAKPKRICVTIKILSRNILSVNFMPGVDFTSRGKNTKSNVGT
jgi:hypothetical protein